MVWEVDISDIINRFQDLLQLVLLPCMLWWMECKLMPFLSLWELMEVSISLLISFFLDEMYPFIMCRTRERILPAKQVIITKSKFYD